MSTLTPQQEACPHTGLVRLYEDGVAKESWTCSRCDLKFVTADMLLTIVKAVAAAMSLDEWDLP